jgi:type IV pilus assembly protein PilV
MPHLSRGFSLLEALVALAVLSVGLLGAAAMLLRGLRDQAQALRHGAATTLLADMADRIRANPSARAAYDTRTASAGVVACREESACDAASLAAHDVAHFQSAARALLPRQRPRTTIDFEPATGSTAPDRYVVSLRWTDPRDPDAADEATLFVLAQPVAGAP